MKLFNYLKLAVIFSILILAFSCNDNENLDEIIEPELELVGRENSFTTDGIIVKDDTDNDNDISYPYYYGKVEFCYKKGLNLTEKEFVRDCALRNFEIKEKKRIILLHRLTSYSNCEVWFYYKNSTPNDGDSDDNHGDDDDLTIGVKAKSSPNLNDFDNENDLSICGGLISFQVY